MQTDSEVNPYKTLDDELDNYSITNQKDSGNFFLHTRMIIKKKILMQARDFKTLTIDILFPLVLIIVGLVLSTTQFYVIGDAVDLSPFSIYPTPNQLYINSKPLGTSDLRSDEIYRWLTSVSPNDFRNGGLISQPEVDLGQNNLINALKDYAEQIFTLKENRRSNDNRGFAEFYVNSIDSPYDVVLLLNSSSIATVGSWSSYI